MGPTDLGRWAVDPLLLIQRVADQVLAVIGHADGVLIGLMRGPDSLQHVCGSGRLASFVGQNLVLDGSLSGSAIRSRATLVADDTEADPRVNRNATRAYGVRSSVCVPLHRGDEDVGVLSVSSAQARAFDAQDVTLLGGLADFVSTFIGAATDFGRIADRLFEESEAGAGAVSVGELETAAWFIAHVLDPVVDARTAGRTRIERIISAREFSLVFQPIFDINSGELFGVEELARFSTADREPPNVVLAAAHEAGLGIELELELIAEAIGLRSKFPSGALLMVNAGPETISSMRIAPLVAGSEPGRLVVELTEQVAVDDYPRLGDALVTLREIGARLAIDDTGAGFASLMHILQLGPDFIKLDRQLTAGIDADPVRRALASALTRFAHETRTTIMAEGIETAAELNVLRDLGIMLGQGYYLAPPGPSNQLQTAIHQGAERIRRSAAQHSG